jgi:hypothetical protein
VADPYAMSDDYEEGYRDGFEDGKQFFINRSKRAVKKSHELARSNSTTKPKKRTRKASKYNLTYAKVYKSLKKKHPRTSFSALAKKAHKETKRRMKK